MGRTIGELFRDPNSYKYGTNYSEVKADTETLVEQETTGIRVKSLVDVNNPLIYGNEATRITLRSTPDLERMKENAGGGAAGGGLLGGAITKARDFVNDKLGIPTNQIPTKVSDKIIELREKKQGGKTSADPVTNDFMGKNGTGLGALIKSTGGGNPSTIGKQALGKGIGFAKDKLRGALFGGGQTINDLTVGNSRFTIEYSNANPYTSFMKDERDYKNEGGYKTLEEYEEESPVKFGNESVEQIDLRKVSPAYAVGRGDFSRFGNTEYAFEAKTLQEAKKLKALYNIDRPYSTYYQNGVRTKGVETGKTNSSLENLYQIGSTDGLNRISIADNYKLDENQAFIKVDGEENAVADLIPLWFRRKGATKPIAFRAILSGLTESTTPSWSGQRFLGNPYQFYLYEGVERSVSFGLKVAAASPTELANNWERLKRLTTYTYPTIKNGLSNPPIIEFRLGSMYSNRVAFIESLQYTIPDEGVWETDGNVGYLPKFIDVSMTMKFIEQDGDEDRVYDFDISKAAVDKINENREVNFSTNERVNSNGTINKEEPVKISIKKQTITQMTTGKQPTAEVLTSVNPNVPNQTVPTTDTAAEDAKDAGAQSAAADALGGKTPIQAAKEEETNQNITRQQARVIQDMNVKYGGKIKVEIVKEQDLPYLAKQSTSIGTRGSIYVKNEGAHFQTGKNIYVFYEVYSDGDKFELLYGEGQIPADPTPYELALEKAIKDARRKNRGVASSSGGGVSGGGY